MGSVRPSIRTASVNTDCYGFRYVIDRDGNRMSPETGCEGPVSILLGASAGFGVGSTSDAATIPSALASQRGEPWYNLSVRGFGVAQNLVQTLFFLPKLGKIRRIVLCTGATDLMHYFSTPIYPKTYGGFFDWMIYFGALNRQFIDRQSGMVSFTDEFRSYFEIIEDPSKQRDVFLATIRGALENWKMVAQHKQVELYFVLAPILGWTEHELSPEEEVLAGNKVRKPDNMRVAEAYREWYGDFLRETCAELNIEFIDLNKTFGSATPSQWFYFDISHYTDQGVSRTARMISEFIDGHR
jgi:hypothetical protein